MLCGADRFLRSLWAGLHPAPQHFSHAPGLRHAATGRKRLFGIEDLADGANTGLAKMRLKAVQKASGSRIVIWIRDAARQDTHAAGPHFSYWPSMLYQRYRLQQGWLLPR